MESLLKEMTRYTLIFRSPRFIFGVYFFLLYVQISTIFLHFCSFAQFLLVGQFIDPQYTIWFNTQSTYFSINMHFDTIM